MENETAQGKLLQTLYGFKIIDYDAYNSTMIALEIRTFFHSPFKQIRKSL